MINPILGNKKYLIIYLLLWAVIISAHSFSLYYFYDLPGLIAVLDGTIYN